jgi:hypothetical protein
MAKSHDTVKTIFNNEIESNNLYSNLIMKLNLIIYIPILTKMKNVKRFLRRTEHLIIKVKKLYFV